MNKQAVLGWIFLVPATIIIGPPLVFFVFAVIPLGILAPRNLPSPIGFLELLFVTAAPLLGMCSAWFVKFYGIDRIRHAMSVRIITSALLIIGIAGGTFGLSWIVVQKNNGFASDFFLMLIVLPALATGLSQLFRIVWNDPPF